MTALATGLAKPSSIVSRVIDRWSSHENISPNRVADASYIEPEFDPEGVAPILVRYVALLELRHVARQILSERLDPKEEITEQHELWPNLQKRYPKARGKDDEPEYVPLENLAPVDYEWNLRSLRSSAAARLKHADALEQHGITQGVL